MLVQKLDSDGLRKALDAITHPVAGFPSDYYDQLLMTFCLNCPDPGAAMDLVVEDSIGMTVDEIVSRALEMPPRAIDTWSAQELPMDHPLRHWKVQS